MPGTTSYGMPAARSASSSSPPRPKMNGSPPFRRTTRRPGAGVLDHAVRECWSCDTECPPAGLADADPRRVAARERKHLVRNQAIVQDHVGVLQRAQRVQRQEPGIARSGTDQHDGAAPSVRFASSIDRSSSRSAATRRRARSSSATRPRTTLRIEPAARREIRERARLMRPRQRSSSSASGPNDSSSSRLEALADEPREHRRRAAARYRDHERRAIDDRRHDEARQLRVVDDVDEQVARRGAAAATRAFSSRSSVAAIARTTPSRCSLGIVGVRRVGCTDPGRRRSACPCEPGRRACGATTSNACARLAAAAAPCARRLHRRRRPARGGPCRSANSGK